MRRNRSLEQSTLALACVATALLAGVFTSTSGAATKVSPALFQEVSTGVALIKTFGCGGKLLGQGTGFLVGDSVVMTARHVLQGSCRVRVTVGGERFTGQRWAYWSSGRSTGTTEDLATLKLDRASSGYVFRVRPSSPPAGTNLGMVGYPLGNRLSLNQGKIIWRGKHAGAPFLAVKMLGAEGASGSPFIDDRGRVVGILQIGLGSEDVLGQRTAGVLVGLDLVRWWGPRARLDLCRSYPNGGIAGCNGSTASPPSPAPSPTLTVATARAIAASATLTRDDLSPDWTATGSKALSPEGPCAVYFRLTGLLASRVNSFTNAEEELLYGSVAVYRQTADARAAYALTSSQANLDCFAAEVESAVTESLSASETLDAFSAQRTSLPRSLGDASSSGYLEWTITDLDTQDVYVGRLYWWDVLARNGVLGFQLVTYYDTPFFGFFSAFISSTERVSGYRP